MIEPTDRERIDVEPIGLTTRETEVLEWVASGYSSKEIGNQLQIAARTVERHTENIRLKLRARNRAHMVAQAVTWGVLEVEAKGSLRKADQGAFSFAGV